MSMLSLHLIPFIGRPYDQRVPPPPDPEVPPPAPPDEGGQLPTAAAPARRPRHRASEPSN